MSEPKTEQLTAAQRDALATELAELEGPRRTAVVHAIKTAREHGDLSENAEYHAAKNEQGFLEARIRKLRAQLHDSVLVDESELAHDEVSVGSIVEIEDETGQKLGERGHEFGTVTGRKRRCGWFDAVLVRQTVLTCGIDGLALTKLDILDGFDEIKVCVRYRLDGREIDYLPAGERAQARAEPVYETIDGWKEPTARARSWAQLPAEAIKYVRRIEELIGCPVALLSTSPEREDTILMRNPFET